jgi:hypothetical protein
MAGMPAGPGSSLKHGLDGLSKRVDALDAVLMGKVKVALIFYLTLPYP